MDWEIDRDRSQMQGNVLRLSLGLSHDVDFEVPEEVSHNICTI